MSKILLKGDTCKLFMVRYTQQWLLRQNLNTDRHELGRAIPAALQGNWHCFWFELKDNSLAEVDTLMNKCT